MSDGESENEITSARMALASILTTTSVFVTGGLFGGWVVDAYSWVVFIGVFASFELVTTITVEFLSLIRGGESELSSVLQVLKELGFALSFWTLVISMGVIIVSFGIATLLLSVFTQPVSQSVAFAALAICVTGQVASQLVFP